jgi:hypothetical protein
MSCQASKLKISGKYGACRLSADAKAVKTGDAVDYSRCSLDKFADAETRSEGACPTIGDQSAVEPRRRMRRCNR